MHKIWYHKDMFFKTKPKSLLMWPQKHGYARVGAYPVSETYPIRIRLGYGRDTYPRRVRVSQVMWAGNLRMETSRPSRYGPAAQSRVCTVSFSRDLLPSPDLTQPPLPHARAVRLTQPPLPPTPPRGAQIRRPPASSLRPCRRRGGRRPASALAGDEEPPRRPRRAAPGLQQRALAGCPPEEWNCGRRACLMSWRATTALRPPRRPDG